MRAFLAIACWLGLTLPALAQQQVLILGSGGNNLNATAVRYMGFNRSGSSNATESNRYTLVSAPGTIYNLRCTVSVDPALGAGVQSWAFQTMVEGAAAGPTCTISEGATSCASTTASTTIAAGNTLSLRITPANTPTVAIPNCSLMFTPSNAGETILTSSTADTALSTTTTEYLVPTGSGDPLTTNALASIPMAAAGTITALYVENTTALGAGDERTYTIFKNGSTTGVSCAIDDSPNTCNTTAAIVVALGDTISLESSITAGSPVTATVMQFGMTFVPATPGEFVYGNASTSTITDLVNNTYNFVSGSNFSYNTTSTNRTEGAQPMVIRRMYVSVATDPTAAGSWTFSFNVGGSNAGPTCPVTTGTCPCLCNNATETTVANDNLIAVQVDPTGTPVDSTAKWGIAAYIAPRNNLWSY